MGRWQNKDPYGEAGGWNLYSIVNNNIINYIDPYGLFLNSPSGPTYLEAAPEKNLFQNWIFDYEDVRQDVWAFYHGYGNGYNDRIEIVMDYAYIGVTTYGGGRAGTFVGNKVANWLQRLGKDWVQKFGKKCVQLRLNLAYGRADRILKSSGGLPNTGVAYFDRLIAETGLFKRWVKNLEERGYTVVMESLPKGESANIVKKTVTIDHAQFRFIDLLHEPRHIGQLGRAAREGITNRSKAIRAVFERGAYEYELRLASKFGFSDEYVAWLEKRIKDYWTKSVARKYGFSKKLQNLWR